MHSKSLGGIARRTLVALACGWLAATALPAAAQSTVRIMKIVELSGAGATSGTMFSNGAELAGKEINAAGGILGRKIEFRTSDTQSNPGVAKGLAAKASDEDAYVVMGPVFSGSTVVSMNETRKAEIPNFTGSEADSITRQGNPYIFRTSFAQANSMPKVGRYIAEGLKAKSVAIVYANTDFGKGGRDAIMKDLQVRNIKIAADISTDQGQVDFSSAVLKAKQSEADVIVPYMTEEESARFLREVKKQNLSKPIMGETTIIEQKVLELAGPAANGVRGHVGLSTDASNPAIRALSYKFEKEFGVKPNHNAIKGYIGVYTIKAVTEKVGKFDRKAFAAAMKNVHLSAKDYPGLLMDVVYDDKGDLDRESFLVEVKDGQQVVIETLPPLNAGKMLKK